MSVIQVSITVIVSKTCNTCRGRFSQLWRYILLNHMKFHIAFIISITFSLFCLQNIFPSIFFPVQNGECQFDDECAEQLACLDNICQNPCQIPSLPCGQNALCKVISHRPICHCPLDWAGDPHHICYQCKTITI